MNKHKLTMISLLLSVGIASTYAESVNDKSATSPLIAKDAAAVTESGKPAGSAPGVKCLRQENGRAIYQVGSGSYRFVCATK